MSLADLGRLAVACKHWRWMPGMRIVNPQRVTFGHGRKAAARYCTLGFNDEAFILESKNAGSMDTPSKNDADWHPDLEDPATLGCLLHLVRQAWEDEDLSADKVSRAHNNLPDIWQVYVWLPGGVKDVLSGRSEAEALVAALEAAP